MVVDKPTSVVLVCYYLWIFFDLYNICSTEWVTDVYNISTYSLFKGCTNNSIEVLCSYWSSTKYDSKFI